ncbi:MAG: electron transfer flavoprotein subunit beta/FixA family protein [Candidatus Limnocylindrales bacterium]
MRIVVLLKAVPVVGTERLTSDLRTDRSGTLEANGADEYLLEAALKLAETSGAEVTLLTIGPAGATEALRKGLAMGAASAVHVADDQISGSDATQTVELLAAALGRLEYELVFCGADSSDGGGGVVPAALAVRLGLPYLSYASQIDPAPDGSSVRIRRLNPTGYDVLEAPTPALVMGTQVLGEPRYPSLRGIMQARSKQVQTWTLADLGFEPSAVGAAAARTAVVSAERPPERGGATVIRDEPDAAVQQIVEFLATRRLL